MELTLKRLLEQAEFKKYRKGYDPVEVDDFLDRAAAMAAKVEVQLTAAMEQAKGGGDASAAAADPAEIEAEVERRVADRLAQQPAGGPSEDDMAEEVRRTIVLAQRTADAAVREAREDADKILSSAKQQAETLVADAQARADALDAESTERAAASKAAVEAESARERREARQRLAAEISDLEGVRESLRSDVHVLERHVEEQRTQLGSTLAELQQILDDPSGFRLAPVPTLLDPEVPDLSDATEPEPESQPEPQPEASVEPAAESEPATAPEPAPEPDGADASAAPAPADGPVALTFDEVDHAAPGVDDPAPELDAGPPTAPVSAVDLGLAPAAEPDDDGDDAFLAELRKAMADDEPLGPRDADQAPTGDPFLDDDDRRGRRFGRRR